MPNWKKLITSGSAAVLSDLTLSGVTQPEIKFNGTSDASVDMAIRATPEGLDFYEPEDGNKIHMQIIDDGGVDAKFGLKINGTSVLSSGRALSNVSGNISMFTNNSGYTTNTGTTTAGNSQTFTNKGGNISQWTNDSGYITSFTNTVDMGDGFKIANSGGTDQFTVTENEEIRFAGSGATSVAFDASTQKITISSTDNNTTYSVGDGGLSQKNFTTTLKSKLDGIAASANNYVLPTNLAGDDINVDTGALSGATVISDLDFNITTNTSGLVTDANGSVATRTLTLGDLGYTGVTNANRITNNNQITNGAGYITSFTNTVDMGSGFIVANTGGTSQFTIVEDNALRFAGSGATSVSFNSTTKKVTISSTDTNTEYSVGDGGLSQKNFTTTLKSKLDGIASSANNYSHPTYNGDDFSVDTGALTGATVVSDIDINVTTDGQGHVTDANGSVATRTLTLANLGYTGATDATNNTGTVTSISTGNANTLTKSGTTSVTLTPNVGAVTNGGGNLATGNDIYDHVTSRISGLTSNVGDITGVTAGTGLSGGASSGTATLNSVYLPAVDDRDMKPNTSDVGSSVKGIKPFFTSLGGMTGTANTDYQDALVLDTYSDSSGGNANCLIFDKNAFIIKHYNAASSATTWGTPKTIAYTSDIITNNNQISNGAGYTTNTGTTTPSNSQTFTNKSGNISQWTNNSGYVTTSGNTIIGTDSDINTSGATVVDQLNMTDGVIQSHSTRTLTLANLGYTGDTDANKITNNNQLTNGAGFQTSAQVNTAIATVVDSAPSALNTLNELAAALGDDADFAGSVTTALSGKLSTSGTAANSTLLDSLDLHTGRNNEANKVVRTDGNGYANFGWINTTSGTASGTLTRIYCSQDSYLRYLSPSAFLSSIGVASGATNVTNNNQISNGAGYTTNTGTVTSVATGTGLDGSFSTSGTITLDLSELTDMTATVVPTTDEIILLDNGAERRKRFSEIFGSNAYTSTTIPTNNNQIDNGRGYITSFTNTVDMGDGFKIANSGGTDQFTVTENEEIRFAGGGATSVSFDASTQKITISSTDTNTDTNTTYLLKAIQYDGSNTNPYIKLDASSGTDDLIQLTGGGATSITRNSDGQITISSTDTNTNTTYSANNGISLSGTTFSHSDTSSQSSVNGSGRTYIQDITLDTYGHVTGLSTATETVVNTDTNTVDMGDGFIIEDGDGTEVRITENKEVKFKEGTGIDINWTDTSTGSDGDPYDLTITNTAPAGSTHLNSNTTKSDVGLSNVANESRATILAGNLTGTIDSTAVADVVDGAALGATSNQDSTSTIRSGTTKSNVGLSNVANESRATILGGNLTGTINSVAVATVTAGAAAGATANQDSTSTIRSGTTKSNVGLSNVENTALSTYTGEGGALDNEHIANGRGYTTNTGDITSVQITTGNGISGGTLTTAGAFSTSLAINIFSLTDMTQALDGADRIIVHDNSAMGIRQKTINELDLSQFDNSTSGFTSHAAANNATITITAGNALTTGGNFTTNQGSNETITINHADTSTQASVNNSNNTVIQDVTLDTYGHVTGLASKTISIPGSASDLDGYDEINLSQLNNDAGFITSFTNTVTQLRTGSGTYRTGNINIDGSTSYGIAVSEVASGYFQIRLSNDRRINNTATDIYTGNTHDYIFFDASHGQRFYTSGAEEMRLENDGDLHVDGDVIAFSTTVSDERLKDNVTTIENPLDKIKALRGVEYDWNSGSRKGKHDLGLIAQEVETVLPNIVHEHQMPLLNDDDEDETLYKTVDYEKMVAVLIEGMKEQQNQIDSLKSELTEIKGRL